MLQQRQTSCLRPDGIIQRDPRSCRSADEANPYAGNYQLQAPSCSDRAPNAERPASLRSRAETSDTLARSRYARRRCMRKTTRCALALAVLCWSQSAGAADQTPAARRSSESIGSIAEKTKGMKKVDGFFPVYWEESEGRLWLEVPRLDVEVLHVTGFATGLGSNDIGIDRGALSGSRIIKLSDRSGGVGRWRRRLHLCDARRRA